MPLSNLLFSFQVTCYFIIFKILNTLMHIPCTRLLGLTNEQGTVLTFKNKGKFANVLSPWTLCFEKECKCAHYKARV